MLSDAQQERTAARHWADRLAEEIAARPGAAGARPTISTGISPSGEIHIGNMREVLTGDAIFRALRDRGIDASFHYIADNFDPLRRVYPFLDERSYAPYVGHPLSEIPAPSGDAPNYAEHFLRPFVSAMRELDIQAEVLRADALYKSGRMNPYIVRALERRDAIAAILRDLTGKEVDEAWSPFTVLSPVSGRMIQARVVGWSADAATVDYEAADGERGTVPMAGGGKLVWRIDWPARWCALGVTVEPFGKDHATRGGSYETGVRIAREIFDGDAPFPIQYEWIRLKGGGDMSSSKGNVLSIGNMLEVVPPDVLRYLVLRERPQKSIAFDPGLPLLQLVDEVDDVEAKRRDARALELSRAGRFEPVGVPFKHLVVVGQAVSFDADRAVEALHRTGYAGVRRDAVADRLAYARRWLERFAPEDIRFTVSESLPEAAAALDDAQRGFLRRLSDRLDDSMDGEDVHRTIYDTAQETAGAKPADLFRAIYVALLGKARGPRAGWFIALLGPAFCAARFREAGGDNP